MAGRGKPGREPDGAKREMFAALIAKGESSAQASRIVGINPRTGKRWRNGRKVVSSSGRVLEYAPVIATRSRPEPSVRCLSQDERIRIADLRREGLSVRQVAARLVGRLRRSAASCAATPERTGPTGRSRRTGRRFKDWPGPAARAWPVTRGCAST